VLFWVLELFCDDFGYIESFVVLLGVLELFCANLGVFETLLSLSKLFQTN
jgi:hypothetical protein